jgi:hypothetical protein
MFVWMKPANIGASREISDNSQCTASPAHDSASPHSPFIDHRRTPPSGHDHSLHYSSETIARSVTSYSLDFGQPSPFVDCVIRRVNAFLVISRLSAFIVYTCLLFVCTCMLAKGIGRLCIGYLCWNTESLFIIPCCLCAETFHYPLCMCVMFINHMSIHHLYLIK